MKLPFVVAIRFNPAMKRWDLQVMVGGFGQEEAAKEAAKQFAEYLAESGSYAAVSAEAVQ